MEIGDWGLGPDTITEERNPRTAAIDTLSTLGVITWINDEDAQVAPAVRRELPHIAQAVDIIVERFQRGGRLFYFGAGTSGRLGVLDASEMPPTYGVPPDLVQGLIAGGDLALRRPIEGTEDDAEAGEQAVRQAGVGAMDVAVGIAASGNTPWVMGALTEARRRGAATIALTCSPGSALVRLADVAIVPIVGPEVIAGSSRMKAGTAQKMVLNTLSTAAMIRLGKVYSNLMVDVQPTNAKLRRRAQRIVAAACGISMEEAVALLARCDGEVKTAIVAYLAGVTPGEARRRLSAVRGRVRAALEQG